MARLFVECDRCGGHFSLPRDDEKANAVYTDTLRSDLRYTSAKDGRRYVLCEKCMGELVGFFDDKGGEK